MDTLDVKLLRRSIGQRKTHLSIKPLYRHKSWVTDLDIVNELGGHTGCVNALSWSTGGNLLASGSDDTYLNIWAYNPSNIARPFTLNTSVSTGHHANIFSVKFMPHSGDRTIVTCAGDSEVRVFDLEYGGADRSNGDTTTSTRSRKFNTFFRNATWLTDSNTNARVYRSHSDRAKRIVTESSPHLFLSCSEDGEVRQWDLRQPSSAYPPPAGARRSDRYRMMYGQADDATSDVPPPLISYRKYDLDLNSISCSSSQPHYIALGGTHSHCFLHDRRMLGRDISNERGQPGGRISHAGSRSDEVMREATKCVRRFAPNNKRKAQSYRSSHITACKISDARPNELISSWSGDHIYSFDIVKSPDARDTEQRQEVAYQKARLRNKSERKRKRALKAQASANSLQGGSSADHALRRVDDDVQEDGNTALRVRYGNGETENVSTGQGLEAMALLTNDALLTEAQQQAQRIARSLVRLRKTLFDFSAVLHAGEQAEMERSSELTSFTSQFTNVLGQACSLLPDMEEVMNDWTYPVNPTPEEVEFQNTLRRNRQSAWRFVQAAGVVSKVLGGRLITTSSAPDPRLERFTMIRPAPRERISDESRFYYDFLKAILLWLDGGASLVLEGFKKPSNRPEVANSRFLFDANDTISSMVRKLQATLQSIANDEKPILDLDANRFLNEGERTVFSGQKQGVNAFIGALSSVELRVNQGQSEPGPDSKTRIMDKGAAARYWGVKVGRSLLMEAAREVNFAFVQQAFGGSNVHIIPDLNDLSDSENDIDITQDGDTDVAMTDNNASAASPTVTAPENQDTEVDVQMNIPLPTIFDQLGGDEEVTDDREQSIILEEDDSDEQEDDNDHDDNSDDEDDDDDDDEESDDEETPRNRYRARVGYGRGRAAPSINQDVPYSTHSKVYKGHCNARTVKDVNYYGLDDEYVVSGSDDGHFFIWDRKTTQIVNILEGDGEIVNVVQGHPYEPMIACSGIDSTIKIFGPGGSSRERTRAAKGIDIANPGGSVHSSLRFGGRQRRAAADSDDDQEPEEPGNRSDTEVAGDEPASVTKNGLKSRKAVNRMYEITSQNDAERQRGIDDTYLTEGMLARFAAALQRGELQGIAGQGFGGTGGTIVIDQENCSVM